MKHIEKYKNWLLALAFVIIVIAVYKTFDNFYKVIEIGKLILDSLSPFFIGFVIAYLLNMPCKKVDAFCRKSKYRVINNKSRAISIASVYLMLVLVVYVVVSAIAPALYRNIVDLYAIIPVYIDEILGSIESWQKAYNIEIFEINEENITKALNSILGNFNIAEFSKYAKGVIDITSGVINVFIGLIISVYLLIDKEKIKASLRRFLRIILKDEKSNNLIGGIRKIDAVFSKYLVCLLVDALVMAIMASAVLSLLRVRYAMILGVMIGVLNLIPYFGAIFAVAISIVITLITGGVFKALWAAIALLVIQQVDGNFIGPKIMGRMLDASPLWIIFAVFISKHSV